MSTLTISLPDPLAERLLRESMHQSVSQDVIVRQALERTLPPDVGEGNAIFDRLMNLVVDDPSSPEDLATHPTHMEGFGAAHSA